MDTFAEPANEQSTVAAARSHRPWWCVTVKFWCLWGFDAIVALVFLFFFVAGVLDESITSFNIRLWAMVLLALGGIVGGSLLLRTAGHPGLAMGLLLVLVVPALLALIFMIVVFISRPRWN